MKSKQIGQNRSSDDFSAMLEESLEQNSKLTPGTPVPVTVTSVKEKEFVFVKSARGNGMIDRGELLDTDGNITVSPGQKLDAFYYANNHGDHQFTIAPRGEAAEAILNNALENNVPMVGKIAGQNKGGYEILLGDTTAFCPGSQLGLEDDSLGKWVTVLVTEISGKRIIVSHRAFSQQEKDRRREGLVGSLNEGDIVSGTITSLQNFGAFVDLGGFEGLIPISELSFKRITHPKEVVKSGEEIRVKVLALDWKEDRITLSLRSLLENPWQGKLPFEQGDIVEGEVDSIKHFGIFVKLPDNFTGLIPLSQSDIPRGQRPEKFYEEGKVVRVMIQKLDRENEKISLSTKSVADADSRQEYQEYMDNNANKEEEGSVSSFGAALKASLDKKDK